MQIFLDSISSGILFPSRMMRQATLDGNDPNPPLNIEHAASLPPAPEALPLLHNALNTLLRR